MNTSLRRKRWARSKKPATVTPRSTGRNTTDRDSSRNVDAEGGQTKTRDRDTTVETAVNRVKIQITLPDELKWWQMDEHDAIKRQHKLLDIPAKKTAKDIIDAYIQWKKSSKSNTPKKEALIADLTGGLIAYFNHELGPNLLYLWERPQYAEILQQYPDTPLVNIYGSFHLLRLFVRLGPVLSFCLGPSDEKGARNLQSHLEDFVKYLDQNRAALFSLEHFADASPEYHRKAQQIEMCWQNGMCMWSGIDRRRISSPNHANRYPIGVNVHCFVFHLFIYMIKLSLVHAIDIDASDFN